MASPDILALDFDGVVCDGLREYFQTAWRAYTDVFEPSAGAPPEGLAERFYPLRPVVETGWEMPLVLYGLMTGIADQEILERWSEIVPQLLEQGKVEPQALGQAVDSVRDRWIHTNIDDWLSYQRFYPGVVDRLQQAIADGVELVIISTKEGRFIQQLLIQGGIALPGDGPLGPEPGDRILGKEVKRPKYETLRLIKSSQAGQTIWFVEDRLKALQAVQRQPDLGDVGLFLADWGYNTAADRAMATQGISRLTLPQFCGSFANWPLKTE
ncbi:HAD family hydrolase [Nodosilinea sp. LEGE 06152]|uniref:HAD family hydrolase n=1 Tax=Nodosilinea sp. LEGE 06152 TaxID=2777966 RepID=UPI00187F1312|nr:HAD family hydrolase [Nodosilinea sp. LEGE 06152]MBE9155570.1 HAD family hydrolase [Nodosilinea sp. LEGE 06152]